MRYSICLLFVCFCVSCNFVTRQPPNVFHNSHDSALHNVNGCWMLQGKKYSGYIVELDSGAKVGQVPIIDGRENGIAFGWYANGHKRYERGFVNGNRAGEHEGWYANGQLAFLYRFRNDKYHGLQQTWFENGQLWQSLTYVNGYEEGRQKSWNDSGRVINNFTVRKGKLYGVIGRYDCISVIKK